MSRIYIVDDEPIICVGLHEMIKEYNRFQSIRTFTDGLSALTAIKAEPPDVIMTDIRMPRMDGLELCRQINEQKLVSKVIVLSGYNDFSFAQKCMSYGVKEYLLKPVTEIELFPVLDKLLAQGGGMGAISLSQLDDWLEQVVEAVWTAHGDKVDELLGQIRANIISDGGDVNFQRDLVKDILGMLVKKLNAQGTYSFALELTANAVPQVTEEVCSLLEGQIREWSAQLLHYRGGNQLNMLDASLEYINTHLSGELSLELVADQLGLTPAYFSHYFKKMKNESFVQYRLRKRIERAKQLLAIPHMKIIDVVAEVGYESYPHFSRQFKKVNGYSPTEYRNHMGIK